MADLELWGQVTDLTPANLTVFARTLPDPVAVSDLSEYLPNRTIAGIESQVTRVSRTRTVARYRSWNTQVPIGERPVAVARERVELAPLGQMLVMTEWQQILIEISRNGGNIDPVLDRIIEQAYDDIAANVQAIRERLRLARGSFLTSGKFGMIGADENGLKAIEYDAMLPDSHKAAPAVPWTDVDNATPLSDELSWNQRVRTDAQGAAPTWAFTDPATLLLMRQNAEYIGVRWKELPSAQRPGRISLGELNDIRTGEGLPPLASYEDSVSVDKVTTRTVPLGQFVTGSPVVGETQFGWTAEMLGLRASNAIDLLQEDSPGVTAIAWKRTSPLTGYTQATATAMPVAGDINGLYSTNVLGG